MFKDEGRLFVGFFSVAGGLLRNSGSQKLRVLGAPSVFGGGGVLRVLGFRVCRVALNTHHQPTARDTQSPCTQELLGMYFPWARDALGGSTTSKPRSCNLGL